MRTLERMKGIDFNMYIVEWGDSIYRFFIYDKYQWKYKKEFLTLKDAQKFNIQEIKRLFLLR